MKKEQSELSPEMANTHKGNSAEFKDFGDSLDSGNLCDSVKLLWEAMVGFGHLVK